eukprot:PLAT4385.1.p1 GENE.PLAT4385.1~~PLAT4385.1.p1  ORF type:complete len:445 (-),score=150.21 PLAT4385.1:127-1302(-)
MHEGTMFDAGLRGVMEKAIRRFNLNPKKGVRYLLSIDIPELSSAEGIGRWLFYTKGVNKDSLGEWLGDIGELHAEALKSYVQQFQFKDMPFELALRYYLSRFKLPGEAQKIDRLVEEFGQHYYACNPAQFSSSDTVGILAFSTIMLNTDLHNAMVRRKMTKPQFVRNNRGIDDGSDLPAPMLEALYDSIAASEIRTEREREDDGTLFTHPDLAGRLRKRGGRIKTWKTRWFILSGDILYYFKSADDVDPAGFFPLENVVVRNRTVKKKFFFEICPQSGRALKSVKFNKAGQLVRGRHESCLLRAQSNHELTQWMRALNKVTMQTQMRLGSHAVEASKSDDDDDAATAAVASDDVHVRVSGEREKKKDSKAKVEVAATATAEKESADSATAK